ATARAHHRLGLEPSLYFAGYNFLLSQMIVRISQHYSGSAQQKTKLQSAFLKAALLDMDFVTTLYFDESKADRTNLLGNIATEFSQNFGGIFGVLDAAAKDLNATANAQSNLMSAALTKAKVAAETADDASMNVQTVASAATELSASVQ